MKVENAARKLASMRKTEVVNCGCGETFKRTIHKSNLNPPQCERCKRKNQQRRARTKKMLAITDSKGTI